MAPLGRVLSAHEPIGAKSRPALAIEDGGAFDLDGAEKGVVDPAFVVEATRKVLPAGPFSGSA